SRGNRSFERDRRVSPRSVRRSAASLNRMKVCYLDAFSGISGDMTVGALIDAGANRNAILDAVASLGTGAKLEIEQTTRRGIRASKFRVTAADAPKQRHL